MATTRNNNNKAAAADRASRAKTKLLQDLAKQLLQFSKATSSLSNSCCCCAFYSIADWFWTDGLDFAKSQPQVLACLLQEMLQQDVVVAEKQETANAWRRRLVPKLRERLREVLDQYQQSSGAVPSSEDEYQLIQAVFDCCGPLSVFERQDGDEYDSSSAAATLEKFVMNDLLRWTVIHTSTLSAGSQLVPQQQSSKSLVVEQDFCLLSTCLAALVEQRRVLLWESFLREIIAAKCDLELLSVGLRTLVVHRKKEEIGWVVCETLDNFAIQMASPTTKEESNTLHGAPERKDEISGDDESFDTTAEDVDYEKKLDFYSTCVGVISDSSPTIVGDRALSDWIEYACPSQSSDDGETSHEVMSVRSVLEVLLQVVQKKRSMLSSEQVDRVLIESWRCPHHLYALYTNDMLRSDLSLRDHFVSIASRELKQDLTCYVAKACSADKVKLWSMRAWRILRVCKDSDAVFPSLSIGPEDVASWKKNPRVMFELSMSLFQNMEAPSDRFALVESWCDGDECSKFLCSLLISLSEASSDPVACSEV